MIQIMIHSLVALRGQVKKTKNEERRVLDAKIRI